MQIRRGLHINAGISALVAVAIALMLLLGIYRLNRSFNELDLAVGILSSLYEKDALRSDYLKTGSQRAKVQWLAENEQTGRLLKAAAERFGDDEEKKIIREMIKDHEASTHLFNSVVENRQKARSGAISGELSREIESRLLTQVNIRLYDKVLNIHKLRDTARRRLFAELKMTGWGIALFIMFASAVAAMSSWAMARTIGSRIGRLREGAAVIGEGDLDHRIAIKGDDELAELSRAFDAMTEKLGLSYHKLEKEIAERKRAEVERELLIVELEAAIKDLEGFTYSVSHDLRAPIRHMTSFAQLLREEAWPLLSEQGRSYLDAVVEASGKMGILVDALLEFSRMGRMELKESLVDLNAVVSEARQSLSVEAGSRKIEWMVPELPQVCGDAAMLQLVFLNLLGNGLKFTRNRSPAVIEIGVQEEPAEYVLFVKDNGIGFDMQHSNKLFGVFQRLHAAEEVEGTGIGLANVARIVQRHGGRVWAEGKVGEGAVFYVALPKEKVRRHE